MDELISRDHDNLPEPSAAILNNKKKIKLIRLFETDIKNNKKYMRNYAFVVENEFITDNFADSILLKEELALFNYGDTQNQYFKIIQREYKGQNVTSLELLLDNGNKVYLSKSEAKAIVTIWNMAMQGYSFARIVEYETQQTLESWTNALYKFNFLELEQ